MTTTPTVAQDGRLFLPRQRKAIDMAKRNIDTLTALANGHLTEAALYRAVDLGRRGLRLYRPSRTKAPLGLSRDAGPIPTYVVKRGRDVFEVVVEVGASFNNYWVDRLNRFLEPRDLRWRVEAGAETTSGSLGIVIWKPGRVHPAEVLTPEEQQELNGPLRLLIERTTRGGV